MRAASFVRWPACAPVGAVAMILCIPAAYWLPCEPLGSAVLLTRKMYRIRGAASLKTQRFCGSYCAVHGVRGGSHLWLSPWCGLVPQCLCSRQYSSRKADPTLRLPTSSRGVRVGCWLRAIRYARCCTGGVGHRMLVFCRPMYVHKSRSVSPGATATPVESCVRKQFRLDAINLYEQYAFGAQ